MFLNKKKIYEKYIKEEYDVEISFLEGPITRLFSLKNENIISQDISNILLTLFSDEVNLLKEKI